MRHSNVSASVNSTSPSKDFADSPGSMATSKSKRAGSVRSGAGRNRSANPRGVPKANYPFFPQELVERMSQDLHLKNDLEYAYGSLRVALSGVKFFYSVTCKRPWNIFAMLKLQNVHTLPEVITIDADSVTYDYVPSKCPGHKCQHCAGTMGVKEIVFRPVWLELLNLTRPVRPPPALDSS